MICGPSSVLLLGDPPVVERIKLLFSTILSGWLHYTDRIVGTSSEIAALHLEARS